MGTYETEKGAGWVLFAGIMIMIAGFLNVIFGIAAIDDSAFYAEGSRFVIFTDLNTWGWIVLIIGVLQLFAAFSIWSGGEYGRWIGVLSASLNALAILFMSNAFPFAAFMVFIIDVLVIYGLVAYGGQRRAA